VTSPISLSYQLINRLFGFTGFLGEYIVVLKDPTMIKQMTVKYFDHFVNRDPLEHAEADKYLSKSLLLMRDQKWKDMRAIISPVFTSFKMKWIFGLLLETVEDFTNFYENKAMRNGGKIEINTHDVFARVTADGIANTGLGLQGDCVRNEESKIYQTALDLENDFTNQNTFILQFLPKLYKFLGKQICRKSIHDFFEFNVLKEIQRRQEKNILRPDLIQILIQAKEGKLKLEKDEENELSFFDSKLEKYAELTDDDLVAQALVMFLGGFETTAILMQALSYELALNLDVQENLYQEIKNTREKLNGKSISYDVLNEMTMMNCVVSEALRKWPSFRVTSRECTKDFTFVDEENGKKYEIKKGTEILLPIGAIHNDPRFFPNPEQFDPSRFKSENKKKIETGTYLPFGYGPR
jgi:cytochrome P450 family 9